MSAAVPAGTTPAERPRVTLAMLTFNQAALVPHAVEAALAQTYSPLTILFSDDASRDDTFAVIERVCAGYNGPHDVRLVRNPVNLGLARHINRINQIAEGELIVLAAGDDVSVPQRVERLVDCWLRGGRRAHYLCSPVRAMTFDGKLEGVYQSPGFGARGSALAAGLCAYPISIGASEAWTTELVRRFEPMSARVWAEDQVFGFRGRLLGPIGSVDEPLVHYRSGSGIVSTERRFSLRRYLVNQLRGLWIYRQRTSDALAVGRPMLATAIALKFLLLAVMLPASPLLSVLRRWRALRPVTQYL